MKILKKLNFVPVLALIAASVSAPIHQARAAALVGGAVATMAIVGSVLIVGEVVERKSIGDEILPDAVRFVSSNGRDSSDKLQSFLQEVRHELDKQGAEETGYTDMQLVKSYLLVNESTK